MKLNSIFSNLIVFIILLKSGLVVLGQNCPSGYSWNAGSNNCHTGSILISSSYCDASGSRGVFLGYTASSNCPSGWRLLTWNWQYVSNNQITLNDCGMTGPQDYSLFSSVGEGCGLGASPYATQLITFDNSYRYFVASTCNAPFAPYTIGERNYEATISAASRSSCLSGAGSTIPYISAWDYGQSVCQNGYTNFPLCSSDLDECATSLSGCQSGCVNTVGSFYCTCPAGYALGGDGKSCNDINECVTDTSGCSQTCTNTMGSFICSCNSNYTLNANGKACDDINECMSGTNQCSGVAICSNTVGGYNCNCPLGYSLSGDARSCNDINECTLNTSGCTQSCSNSIGSFTCSCLPGYLLQNDSKTCTDINECLITPTPCGQSNCNNIGGSFYCSCDNGYVLSNDNQKCNDVNECIDLQNSCQGNAICSNSIGSFSCSCPQGYELSTNKTACQDINECTSNTHQCNGAATCSNLQGSYQCICPSSGYSLSTDGKSCNDINECIDLQNSCQGNAICANSIGSFSCSCPQGFKLTSNKTACQDINECIDVPNSCQGNAICQNSVGSFSCSCPQGYELTTNKTSCKDINECASNTHQCNGVADCFNLIGSYECNCPPSGYTLSSNGFGCDDIDECQNGESQCVGDFTTCKNTQGSYFCSCPSGFLSVSNGYDCQDINECLLSSNQCDTNTICQNNNGSYTCQCTPNFSHVTPYKCEPKPIITEFYQKPTSFYRFIIKGFNFNELSIITVKNNDTEIDCAYQSGKETEIECTTREGLEVRGNVTVNTNSILSDPFIYIGAPFISSYSKNPSTDGSDEITFFGRNLPTTGTIKLTIHSVDCQIKTYLVDEITCVVPEGSGGFNYVRIQNETSSTTDTMYITYANPFITSTSSVYQSGGILTIYGRNFGLPTSVATVEIGLHQCNNVLILSHTQLTCHLESTNKIFTQLISLVVDGLTVENDYYFTYSTLEAGNCPDDCNSATFKGKCTSFGCECNQGFTGISCNETSVEIVPSFPPTNPETPSIVVDNGNGQDNGFGYKITIIRIEELDFNNVIIDGSSISLSNAKWNSNSNTDNQWTFNITLENKSYLEATFEYFKQSRNITFASSSFIIPAESLKLSFITKQWPFLSKLNSLRVVVQTDTIVKNENVAKCSIGNSITTTYNQNVWSTTENSESGMVARFVSVAELDSTYSITANIEDLSDSNNKKTSIIGISVPYFSKQSIIDPDFGMLLNVDKKETGDCKSQDKVDWKLATGVSIGAGAAVCLAGVSSYFYRKNKQDKQLKNSFSRK